MAGRVFFLGRWSTSHVWCGWRARVIYLGPLGKGFRDRIIFMLVAIVQPLIDIKCVYKDLTP